MRKGHTPTHVQTTPNTLIRVIQAAVCGHPSMSHGGVLPRLQRGDGADHHTPRCLGTAPPAVGAAEEAKRSPARAEATESRQTLTG